LKVLIPPGKSGNVLATIAIGEQYLQPFMKYAYHTWEMYCRRHDLGLILFDDHLIAKSDPNWKNPYWQKFLIGDYLSNQKLGIRSVCCLDTDILISPLAPNIFENRDETKVGLVSNISQFCGEWHFCGIVFTTRAIRLIQVCSSALKIYTK